MPSRRDTARRTEGSLLAFVIVILVCGFLLVFLAKTRAGVPQDAINLNTATADELAVGLNLDPEVAARIVKLRELLGQFQHVDQLAQLSVFVGKEELARARAAVEQRAIDPSTDSAEALRARLEVPSAVARRITSYRATLRGNAFRRPLDVLKVPLVDRVTLQTEGSRLIVRHPAAVFFQFALWASVAGLLVILTPIALRRAGVGGDPYFLPFSFLLAGLGAITLFSVKDPLRDTPVYVHHIQGLCLGVIALLAAALMPIRTRRNLRHYNYVWAIAGIALLVLLKLFGFGPENVRLSLFFLQPVEIIKLLLVLFTAGYLTTRADLLAEAQHRWRSPERKELLARLGLTTPRWRDLGPLLGVFLLALALFLVVRDMGPALLLFGAFVSTIYVCSGRGSLAALGIGLMVVGGVLANALHVGVVPVRVSMWLSPWDNKYPFGMQLGQSYWAMASGGWSGSGLGLGSPGLMPRGGSDLVFSSLSEELGLIGSLAILLLFSLLVWRGLKAAIAAQHEFDRVLAVGLTALLFCQVFLIVAGVTGLLPLTGITLPFVASGNSSIVTSFFLIGLLRGISAPTGSVAVSPPPIFLRAARMYTVAAAIALFGCIGIYRLMDIQSVRADEMAGRLIRTPDADGLVRDKVNPRLISIERAIVRGSIYDRNGKVLASSRLDEISREMSDAPDKARTFFRRGRYYPRGADFAHTVGYLNPAIGGPAHMERDFNGDLRGFVSYSELLPDYRAKDLPSWLSGAKRRQGRNLVLTLDAEMQHSAMASLKKQASSVRDVVTGKPKNRGALVAVDPQTGEVLASASIPSFDPNTLTPEKWQEIQQDKSGGTPQFDRSTLGLYPPGSTMKVVTASAGLEAGLKPQFDCNHVWQNLHWSYRGVGYGRRALADDKGDPPHNTLHMPAAMRVSCNLYFANLAMQLGTDRFYGAIYSDQGWGLSKAPDLQAFAAALPYNGFGQGVILATPSDMARVAATIAAGGSMPRLRTWRELRDNSGKATKKSSAGPAKRPVTAANATLVAEMMRSVVTDGTASGLFDDLPIPVAGKTGTAQTDSGDKQPHSWFIGFAPYQKPTIAFACLLENGGYGKRGAAPAVRDFLGTIWR